MRRQRQTQSIASQHKNITSIEHHTIHEMAESVTQSLNKMDTIGLHNKPIKSRIRNSGRTSTKTVSATSISNFIVALSTLLLFLSPQTIHAGLSIGGVTNTDSCYAALQSAKETLAAKNKEVITKEGYVAFINDLSDNAFTAFGENPNVEGDWGYFPVSQFEQFPGPIKDQFYIHACGGAFVTCDEAYLYTAGTGEGEAANAQQTIYLFQVCVGVEKAIKKARPKVTPPPTSSPVTSPPTTSPSTAPTPGQVVTAKPVETFTGDLPLQLTYQAVVSSDISTEELQVTDNKERNQLLGAMNSWIFTTTGEYSQMDSTTPLFRQRRMRQARGRRELVVRPEPVMSAAEEFMGIVDVECSNETIPELQPTDHCIQVVTNLTIIFNAEPLGSELTALAYIENEFEKDSTDGTFFAMIPDDTRQYMRAIYPPLLPVEAPAPTVVEEVSLTLKPTFSVDQLIDRMESIGPDAGDEGSGSKAGLISGVCIGIVAVALLAFFAVKRRRDRAEDKSTRSLSSQSADYKKSRREFDPSDDLEAGNAMANRAKSFSSRDEFSSGDSHSSDGSMQSYSSSSGSSGSSGSTTGSHSSYTSSGSTSRSSHSSSYVRDSSSTPSSGSGPYDGHDDDGLALGGSHSPGASSSEGDLAYDDAVGQSLVTASSASDGPVRADDLSAGTRSQGSSASGYHTGSSASSAGRKRHNARSKNVIVNPTLGDLERKKDKGSTTTGDDDSSAGSSGWDSSDGDSSVDSGSVETYDLDDLGSSVTNSNSASNSNSMTPEDNSSGSDTMSGDRKQPYPPTLNPAVNPVVQRGVTMLPIEECDTEEETLISDDSESTGRHERRKHLLPGTEIQDAIEKGDWATVGATAEILASSGSDSDDDETKDSTHVSGSGSASGSGTSIMSDILSAAGEDEDDIRAAEIDALVETGNWDGVVAVAARYADEADEADSQLGDSPDRSKSKSASVAKTSFASHSTPTGSGSSAGSVSVETADASSVYSNTTRDSMSHTTYSVDSSLDDGASTVSGTERSPDPDTLTGTSPSFNTHSSSITSSNFSASGITTSMLSAVSSVDPQEKRQMNAYRAEVEALVRRVVPDEMDNVDDIMVQFSGREEELIETLRSMQEKSIAQRARAAVQRSAKPDLRDVSKRRDDDSEDLGQSEASFTEGGDTYTDGGDQSMTTDGMPSSKGSYASGSSSLGNSGSPDDSRSIRDSITNEYTGGEDDEYSTSYTRSEYESRSDRSSDSTSVSSYTSGSGDSSASEDSSPSILSELGDSIGIISVGKTAQGDDIVKASPGLGEAIDASDWQAVGEAATQLRGGTDGYQSQESSKPHSMQSVMTGMSTDTNDELDGMIDAGNWKGIIDAASNMSTGHNNSSEEVMDSVLDGLD